MAQGVPQSVQRGNTKILLILLTLYVLIVMEGVRHVQQLVIHSVQNVSLVIIKIINPVYPVIVNVVLAEVMVALNASTAPLVIS